MAADKTLTREQAELVEANMGLVGKVIEDKISNIDKLGIFSRDDLFQSGCIGLIKAALADNKRCSAKFSTFAYRCIYNEIIDSIRYANVRNKKEIPADPQIISSRLDDEKLENDLHIDLMRGIAAASENATPTVYMGIKVMTLRSAGYTFTEISRHFGISDGYARVLMCRAKKHLQADTYFLDLNAA